MKDRQWEQQKRGRRSFGPFVTSQQEDLFEYSITIMCLFEECGVVVLPTASYEQQRGVRLEIVSWGMSAYSHGAAT